MEGKAHLRGTCARTVSAVPLHCLYSAGAARIQRGCSGCSAGAAGAAWVQRGCSAGAAGAVQMSCRAVARSAAGGYGGERGERGEGAR
eukprot:scaffold105328_cov30-Phaeocystis_antarctica.AAC.1